MSTTTVIATSELQNVLGDYKIHLTGDNSTTNIPVQELRAPGNPENWPVDYRRVPDYRPIDRNRGMEERPNGSNGFEQGFLIIMFTGVVTNAVSKEHDSRLEKTDFVMIIGQTLAKIWGATGGPYFPRLFRYAIGGEW